MTYVFDDVTIPSALLNAHATKPVRLIEGHIQYHLDDGQHRPVLILDARTPGLIQLEQPHHADLLGPVRFQVEFYDRNPSAIIRAQHQGKSHAYSSQRPHSFSREGKRAGTRASR